MDRADLAVEDLRFRYRRGGEEMYRGLNATFTPGAVTAITGASGRGKSTLLYLLGLLLSPSSGRVLLDGQDVSAAPDAERSALRAGRFGFVFQDSELDPTRTLLDSVSEVGLYGGMPAGTLRPRARELLDRFGLGHRADHRPGQISGGQAQRVALCRALMNDPDIVLADEPTGNLDPGNADLVLDQLTEIAADGRSVLIATHDPQVLARSTEELAL
ncbi:ABC transporter ATP-binding protein [Brachybacterium aquaticum]|uniref:Putative ABC transport system ATP-binding protein/lipoprotein-releasing system ATP-binding protein n=1 Tax=Brachybacterium aquaticum TaxID=1432564 RepID=A0A841AB36_9MICO|nr:ATP-binding cassette domain-containing protein [Brachybacterium aquaticum]MBB5830450.1 putative ABC transport system ATP-binding protein/lipoprotein-releasing system ATP-binding protein [Brachybacterium aquaticum]